VNAASQFAAARVTRRAVFTQPRPQDLPFRYWIANSRTRIHRSHRPGASEDRSDQDLMGRAQPSRKQPHMLLVVLYNRSHFTSMLAHDVWPSTIGYNCTNIVKVHALYRHATAGTTTTHGTSTVCVTSSVCSERIMRKESDSLWKNELMSDVVWKR
jgi:hypothetical protein